MQPALLAGNAKLFVAAHDQINAIFKPRRYRLTANSCWKASAEAFSLWTNYACEMTA